MLYNECVIILIIEIFRTKIMKGRCYMSSIINNSINNVPFSLAPQTNEAQDSNAKILLNLKQWTNKSVESEDSVRLSPAAENSLKASKASANSTAGLNNGSGTVPGFNGTLEPKNSNFGGKANHQDLLRSSLMFSEQGSVLDFNGFTPLKGEENKTTLSPLPEMKLDEKNSKQAEAKNGALGKAANAIGATSSILDSAGDQHKLVLDGVAADGLKAGSSFAGILGNSLGMAKSVSEGDGFGAAKSGTALAGNYVDFISRLDKAGNAGVNSGIGNGLNQTGRGFSLLSNGIGLGNSIANGDAGDVVASGARTAEDALKLVDSIKGTNHANTSVSSVMNKVKQGGAKAVSGSADDVAAGASKAATAAGKATTAKAAAGAGKVAANSVDDVAAVAGKVAASSVDDIASTALKAGGSVLKKAPIIGVAVSAVDGGNTAINEAEKKHGKLKTSDKAVIGGLGAAGGAAGALGGIAMGAAVGSVVPVVGTVVGAVVGGIAGFFMSGWGAKAGGELGQKISGLK